MAGSKKGRAWEVPKGRGGLFCPHARASGERAEKLCQTLRSLKDTLTELLRLTYAWATGAVRGRCCWDELLRACLGGGHPRKCVVGFLLQSSFLEVLFVKKRWREVTPFDWCHVDKECSQTDTQENNLYWSTCVPMCLCGLLKMRLRVCRCYEERICMGYQALKSRCEPQVWLKWQALKSRCCEKQVGVSACVGAAAALRVWCMVSCVLLRLNDWRAA